MIWLTELTAAGFVIVRLPRLMKILPDRLVLVPPRVRVPGPVLVSPLSPARAELMVNPPPYTWNRRSPKPPAFNVPPVMVLAKPELGVTRMPPDWRVFVPLSVRVKKPAVLNRSELAVNGAGAADAVTSTFVLVVKVFGP